MSARLLIFSGKMRGKMFGLPPEGKIIIGRSAQVTMPLPDVNLSRQHCSVTATAQGYVLSDLKSTNGTLLNGKKISQILLREGDRITIGETDLEFRVRDQFDDTETKMDMMPVGVAEEISAREALEMMKATGMHQSNGTPGTRHETPQPGIGGPTQMINSSPPRVLKRVRFCDICDSNIPRKDAEAGLAREVADKMLCNDCIGRLQTKNVDAAASLAHVLEELRQEVQREQG
jgi:predicted component of type VI protein secretion system